MLPLVNSNARLVQKWASDGLSSDRFFQMWEIDILENPLQYKRALLSRRCLLFADC